MPDFEPKRCRPWLIVLAALLPLAGFGCRDQQAQSGAAPPPSVLVETVAAHAIPRVIELPGRIEAIRSAEVRARVDGIVERRLFEEGTDVRAGAPLFLIDPRDYQAALQQAQAALNRAQAVRGNAASEVARFKPLVARQVVSAQEYEAATAALEQAEANVADARAAVTLAQLRLDRCTVRAPIAGRVGRALVTEGALVSAAGATLLTQVNQLSPVNAVFTQSNISLLEVRKQIASGSLSAPAAESANVRLTLANGDDYGETGVLDFTDLVVDPSTGTQVLRARFNNASRILLPGQFVRGRIVIGTIPNGLAVPARAVQFDNNATSLSLVAEDGTVVRRNVVLGPQEAGQWVVKDGLEPGERVIVDGWQRVQPGQRVDAQPAAAPSHS
ncbi:efflux RND transporter periplasmic adaptor subunit [Paraburkholderia unamae]|uniref:Membrane fusion protein (Multidrug efflux system) n=1 Tax=Paraburkholderia unamae TaxID=219649 RepID=A0ABX5KE54_9BURK|nr:efflux RND transporter periplasmic adaptor subunit [Paraburkholderia unamae]PVX75732.1 membrane fusion protein (multidrug efflux system) [Paraburkholderia unamae]CAG9259750.1 Membrane fusion protein (Multidrug efflux system) [Paraburkholderia unamae]